MREGLGDVDLLYLAECARGPDLNGLLLFLSRGVYFSLQVVSIYQLISHAYVNFFLLRGLPANGTAHDCIKGVHFHLSLLSAWQLSLGATA